MVVGSVKNLSGKQKAQFGRPEISCAAHGGQAKRRAKGMSSPKPAKKRSSTWAQVAFPLVNVLKNGTSILPSSSSGRVRPHSFLAKSLHGKKLVLPRSTPEECVGSRSGREKRVRPGKTIFGEETKPKPNRSLLGRRFPDRRSSKNCWKMRIRKYSFVLT